MLPVMPMTPPNITEFVRNIHVLNSAYDFHLDFKNDAETSIYIVVYVNVWHGKLGHVGLKCLNRFKNMNILPNLMNDSFFQCEICAEAKHARKPFLAVTIRTTSLLELIHTDLVYFESIESRGGKRYYITFIDDFFFIFQKCIF